MITVSETGVRQIVATITRLETVLADLAPELMAATDAFYKHERDWFDTAGEGTWPDLAASTIADKTRRGSPTPEKPLMDTGALEQAATSPGATADDTGTGPISQRYISPHQAAVTLNWERDGWQIPVVLSEGDEARGLPARPIFSITETLVAEMEGLFVTALSERAVVA